MNRTNEDRRFVTAAYVEAGGGWIRMMVGGDEPRHLDGGLRNWALFSSCSFLTGHLPDHPSSIAIPPTQGVLCSVTIQGRVGVGEGALVWEIASPPAAPAAEGN